MRLIVMLPGAAIAGLVASYYLCSHERGGGVARRGVEAGKGEVAQAAGGGEDAGAGAEVKVGRLVAVAQRKGDSAERDNELYLAIEAFGAEDLRALLGDAASLKAFSEKLRKFDHAPKDQVIPALVARWLAVDEGGALAGLPLVLEALPFGDDLRKKIVEVFAKKRPEAVLALVAQRKDAKDREKLILGALSALAERNPAKARTWLADCTEAGDRRAAERAVREGTVEADPMRVVEMAGAAHDRDEAVNLLRSASTRAAKTGPGVLRQLVMTSMPPWMLSTVLDEFAERDPAMAVDLAVKASSTDANLGGGIQSAFGALAGRDPALAIAKMEGLSGMNLASAICAIGTAWAEKDPAAAMTWLAGRPSAERKASSSYDGPNDTLLLEFNGWAEQSSDAARAWADALPAGETRDAVQMQLARAYTKAGKPGEAVQVLAALGSAADQKAVSTMSAEWARRDPKAAAEWATGQSPGPVQSSALAGIVRTWANDDKGAVEEWLGQFPAGDARDRSVAAFLGRSSAMTDGAAERAAEFERWFDRIDDPWRRAQVAASGYQQRKQRDPAAARTWLLSLPNLDGDVVRMTLRN
jgi:hypothetical protein